MRLGHWLYPLAFLSITHSSTALLVVLGFAGRADLAAEIGITQGATIATFFALSGNARNLLLNARTPLRVGDLLSARTLLTLPLALIAYLLTASTGVVAGAIALAVVLRRSVEWLAEVHLSHLEVEEKRSFCLVYLSLQAVLFFAAVGALLTDRWAIPALFAWALVPLLPSIPFLKNQLWKRTLAWQEAWSILLPHFASTLAIGIGIYVFRIAVILTTSKAMAGELFSAIAAGSFMGTIFANVLGPSIALRQDPTRLLRLPFAVWVVISAAVAGGLVIAVAGSKLAAGAPAHWTSQFYWIAVGLSIAGGGLMVIAQQARIRLLRTGSGVLVFGPDVFIHLGLVAMVPLAVAIAGPKALAAAYLVNALLSLIFYYSAEWDSRDRWLWLASEHGQRLGAFALAFLVFLPFFFQLNGQIHSTIVPLRDSGGDLRTLPLPLSVLASYAGIVLLGRYRAAWPAAAATLGLFAAMFLTSTVAGLPSGNEGRAKLMLLVQCLLPVGGLSLGMMLGSRADDLKAVAAGLFAVALVLVPIQILVSWFHGGVAITHDLRLFSIYQHQQFVPVVMGCAYLVGLGALSNTPTVRWVAYALAPLVIMYVVASFSALSLGVMVLGLAALMLRQIFAERSLTIAALSLITFAVGAAYLNGTRNTENFQAKYEAFPERPRLVCSGDRVTYVSPLIRETEQGCRAVGEPSTPYAGLISLGRHITSTPTMLVVSGTLSKGAIKLVVRKDGEPFLERIIDSLGPIDLRIPVGPGYYDADIYVHVPDWMQLAVTVSRFGWERTAAQESSTVNGGVHPVNYSATKAELAARNLAQRSTSS